VPNPVVRQVAVLISDETSALREFIAILQEEQTALANGHLDDLLPLSQTKRELAATLSALDDRRLAAIGAAPGSDHAGRMTAWLKTSNETAIADSWRTLLGLASQARELNATNGKLIAERMRTNQQALAILLSASDAAGLYGPDGQPRLGSSGRPLGSA
jgi:flagellar biosynthesis protein FlgN